MRSSRMPSICGGADMTYEQRLKQLHEWVLELATSPVAPREQVIGDLVWLRREVDLQIVALQEEDAEDPPEPPGEGAA
jgi:hypothetical protein